jgi:hypothetical protein
MSIVIEVAPGRRVAASLACAAALVVAPRSQVWRPLVRPPFQGPAMAYDDARQRTVLFGQTHSGTSSAPTAAQTWEYDGGRWRWVDVSGSPPDRHRGAMAYDLLRRRIVLFGGERPSSGTIFGDTWEYDGSTWTQIQPPSTTPGSTTARPGCG